MFLITIKLDRVSFETKGRQNLQKKNRRFRNRVYSLLPSCSLLLTPLLLCMRQQSISHMAMTAAELYLHSDFYPHHPR